MTLSGNPTALLLNPPFGEIAIRDNYCSKISQAAYINHPIDLLIQSGYLDRAFDVHLVDAIVEKMDASACLDRIRRMAPEVVFSLAGNATWHQDQEFFIALRQALPKSRLVLSGDVFLEDPARSLRDMPEIDAISVDYTSNDILRFFQGETGPFKTLVCRNTSGDVPDFEIRRERSGEFRIPLPRHALFMERDYRYPFVKKRRFATVMTEFGCPFHCAFCVMGTLGCKRRPLSDVMEELRHLESMKIQDVFFLDQSFGSDPARNMEFCETVHRELPNLQWVCFSRVDLMTRRILESMKAAGCHTIIFGVETAAPELLKRYRKGYSLDQVTEVFSLARELKIRTVATFLLGLPGETRESAFKTIEFARKLPCNFASLNVAVPRMGTDLRSWALEKGYVDPSMRQFDQSGSQVVMRTEALSAGELADLKRYAVRRLYLNPVSLVRILMSLRSWDEFLIQFREGLHLLTRYTRRSR